MPPCYQEPQGVVSLLSSCFWVVWDEERHWQVLVSARIGMGRGPCALPCHRLAGLAGQLWAGVLRGAELGASNASVKWVLFLPPLLKTPPIPIPGGQHLTFLLPSKMQDRSPYYFLLSPQGIRSSDSPLEIFCARGNLSAVINYENSQCVIIIITLIT